MTMKHDTYQVGYYDETGFFNAVGIEHESYGTAIYIASVKNATGNINYIVRRV